MILSYDKLTKVYEVKCEECEVLFTARGNKAKFCKDCKFHTVYRLKKAWYYEQNKEEIQARRQIFRESNLETIKEQNKDKAKKRRLSTRRFTDSVKLTAGCTDCGYNERASAMDFDHVTGEKKETIGHLPSMRSVVAEIMKCEVVCAICHRIRTEDRSKWEAIHEADRRSRTELR